MGELRVTVARATSELKTPLLVLPLYEADTALVGLAADVDGRLEGGIAKVLSQGDFRGRRDDTLVLYPRAGEKLGAERVLLVGIGKRDGYTVERLRRVVGTAARAAEKMGLTSFAFSIEHTGHSSERMGVAMAARAAAEAAVLASWDFREMKTVGVDDKPPQLEEIVLVTAADPKQADVEEAVHLGAVSARAANFARDLATRPGNVATPTYLANAAREIATTHGMKITAPSS